MTITAPPPNSVVQALATMTVEELLRSVVTEMNSLHPANAPQNDRLLLQVHADVVEVGHPEWCYLGQPAATTTAGPSLAEALLRMMLELRAGTLCPLRPPED